MKKRVLSLALVLVMALALIPTAAWAAEEDGPVIIPLPEEVTGMLTEATYPQFYDGLLRVYTGGEYLMDSSNSHLRYGFVDKTGKFVVPMEYEYAYIGFSSGMASVSKDGKWYMIDTTGKTAFECEEGWYVSPFSGNAAPIRHRVGEKDKYNLIDKTGKLILSTEYDDISNLSYEDETEGLFKATNYDENQKRSVGVINDSGKVIVPLEYDDVYSLSEGLFQIMKYDANGKRSAGVINDSGKVIIPFGYGYNNVSFVAPDRIRASKMDGEDGYFDIEGKPAAPITPAESEQPEVKTVKLRDYDAEYEGTFTDGLAAWKSPDWGYSEAILIDEAGKTVIPRGYENGGNKVAPDMYVDGLAILSKETKELNQWGYSIHRFGVVDRNGGVVVPFEYDRIYPLTEGEKACAAKKDGKFYIIDFSGMTLPLANPTQYLTDLVWDTAVDSTAIPTNDTLKVDGEAKTPTAYKIGNDNYFQLRDVAMLLNGTDAQFSVEYDEARRAVKLTTHEAYTPQGWELAGVPTENQNAMVSNDVIYVNYDQKNIVVYKIGSTNYFKIRDLGKLLGFNVGWTAEKGMFIESDKPYTDAD